jgi:hypothetical protein
MLADATKGVFEDGLTPEHSLLSGIDRVAVFMEVAAHKPGQLNRHGYRWG